MTTATIAPLSPTPIRSALMTLAGVEARRTWRGAALWIGLLLSLLVGWNSREVDWSGGNYSSFFLMFVPLAGAAFVAGVRTAGKDVRTDLPPLGEDAALGDRERSLARLLGLAPFLVVTLVGTAVIEIAIRVEGGMWIGDFPGRTDSAVHTLPELLQPAGLVVVGATAGVAAGRRFRHRVPIVALGVVVTFLNTGAYWVFQWIPMTYVTLVQTQPIEQYAGLGRPIRRPSPPTGCSTDQTSTTAAGDARTSTSYWQEATSSTSSASPHSSWPRLSAVERVDGSFFSLSASSHRDSSYSSSQPTSRSRSEAPDPARSTTERRMFAWVSATTRLVQWGLLAAVVAATLATRATLSLAGVAFPGVLVSVVAAAVAAAAPASLDDPAHDLLAPVAISRRRRIAHRLAIVVPACVVCWSALAPVIEESDRWLSTLPSMGALVAIGVATTCVVAVWRPDASAAAGAAAPLALSTGSVWLPSERLVDATAVWSTHPWPVMTVAAIVAASAIDRPRRRGLGPHPHRR